jgi:hypothetical protein
LDAFEGLIAIFLSKMVTAQSELEENPQIFAATK